MKEVYRKDGFTFYEYSPSITKPFFINMEPLTIKRRIRLLSAYYSGYKVYYLRENDEYVGYCLVQSGSDIRYTFATDKDIMVGPYFIHEKHRGRKLSIFLLDYILKHSDIKFENAYDYIHKNNIPSIKASEAVGFKYFSDANLSKYLRSLNLSKSEKGEYVILKYSNNNIEVN